MRETPESPAPDWMAPIFRWLFQDVPQWVQMAGGVVAAATVATIVYFGWTRRHRIQAWIQTRSAKSKAVLLAALGISVLVAATIGWRSWDYMQRDNDFCTGCHIMSDPFERFASSEHADLSCHDCHQQSIFDSAYQLHMWVTERPQEISEHAPVPDAVCATCHITQDPDSTWQRISATAGHRVHLESDSVDLADVQCVTCHGQEVHRFVPVDQTCGGSACHKDEDTQIALGTMGGQTGIHCVACHAFTAEVGEDAPADIARAALSPRHESCLGCHEMAVLLADFQPDREPHAAACGICHNPHLQETPEAASETCATSACHARADTLTPFHRGLGTGVLENCQQCHEAHVFTVTGDDCTACHTDIAGTSISPGAVSSTRGMSRSGKFRLVGHTVARGQTTRVVAWRYARMLQLSVDPAATTFGGTTDDFDHEVHSEIACTECHASERSHGEVTITERQCQACHHTGPTVRGGCETCHEDADRRVATRTAVELALSVWDTVRTRDIAFEHDEHTDVACAACHVRGPLLSVERGCATCHIEHHDESVTCVACHAKPTDDAHTLAVHTTGCAGSGCHEGSELAASTTAPNVCLSCHQDQIDHEPGSDCASCHWIPKRQGATTMGVQP